MLVWHIYAYTNDIHIKSAGLEWECPTLKTSKSHLLNNSTWVSAQCPKDVLINLKINALLVTEK